MPFYPQQNNYNLSHFWPYLSKSTFIADDMKAINEY